jgi:hypothetical protein
MELLSKSFQGIIRCLNNTISMKECASDPDEDREKFCQILSDR